MVILHYVRKNYFNMKTYIPSNELRSNPLSAIPGGSILTVMFENHEVVYTNIKYPDAYIRRITKENSDIRCILIDGQKAWIKNKLIIY